MDNSGPVSVESTGEMAVPYENGYATVHDKYRNCAKKFDVTCKFPNNTELQIKSGNEDSVWIGGDRKGRIRSAAIYSKTRKAKRSKVWPTSRFPTKCFPSCAKARRDE